MKKLICLVLAAMLLLTACGKEDETQDNPEVTASPTPTAVPTQTPEPTIAPTPVPVVPFDEYQYFILNNTALAVSFKYPSHWINEPGKASIRYTEPVNEGDTPAQLTVTSKLMEDRPRNRDMETQMESFLALVEPMVDNYSAKEEDFKDDVQILDTEGVRQKYTARDPETGKKIVGYALMVYSKASKRIYLLHFTAPEEDYDELSGVIDVIRDSIEIP